MGSKAKIMVVDDEKRICENVQKILSRYDYEVEVAANAEEAMERMARESFNLLISDIVMPGMNGLELLKLVKEQWPLTKVLMFTAYASTDTATKAIRLGALDYIPKPFTPDELRLPVHKALAGEIPEVKTSREEVESMNIIGVDSPFDRDEVAKYTGEEYADMMGRSDMPVVEVSANYCELGGMACDIYKKIGKTCKKGLKSGACPQLEAKKKKGAEETRPAFDGNTFIGIDAPFRYREVAAVTGPEYVSYMNADGASFVPYEVLKENVARLDREMAAGESKPAEAKAQREVLVIDDEVGVNNNIRKILQKNGYEVDQATTREEAHERLDSGDYRLILLDLRIPGVQSLEMLKTVRERQPDASVVIITGYASIETAVETARLGAVDYLSKPFTPDEIRNVSERAIRLAA
jgi:DNA-binding response OmpR family regulator